VTASKIKQNSITTAKIKNGAVTGPKVNVSTLGTVPNATHATTADTATNFSRYFNLGLKKASVGQTNVPLGSVGPFSFVGDCEGTTSEPYAHIFLTTSINGSEMESDSDQFDWNMTTADRAEIGYGSTSSSEPYGNFYSYYDGWVAATPTGSTFLSGEAHPIVKALGADCAFLVYGFNETP
jgi:hypothetical protein